jgi:hypothetical protein
VPAGLFVGVLVAAVGVQVLVATPASAPSYLVGTEPASVSESDPNGAADEEPDADAPGDTAALPEATDDLGAYDPNDPNVDPNFEVSDDDAPPPDDTSADASPVESGPDQSAIAGPPTIANPGAAPAPSPAVTPRPRTTPAPAGSPGVLPPAGVSGATASPGSTQAPSAAPSRAPAAVATNPPPKATEKPAVKPTAKPTAKPAGRIKGRVLAIGDSVMRGATRALRREFSSIEVNATVSRQFNDGIRILRARATSGTLPDVVVIHLGTNGPISKRQFDLAMAAVKNVRLVVFVNVKVPRPWESYTNRTLSQNVKRYPNAVLVNWHDASEDVANALARDGIHLNSAGATAYARLIAAAIR